MKIINFLSIVSILGSQSINTEAQSTKSVARFDPEVMAWRISLVRRQANVHYAKISPQLARAAQAHSEDQAKMRNLTHIGSDGTDPKARATREGYNWKVLGENIAFGLTDEESVTKYWASQPESYKKLIDPNVRHVGFGYFDGYWTGVLAG